MIIEAFALNVLFIEQAVESNMKALSVEQSLSLSQSVACNILPQVLSSSLVLAHVAEVNHTANLVADNSLTLTHAVHPRAFVLEVNQLLFVWSEAIKEEFSPLVRHTLTLTQTAVGVASKHTSTTLALTQSVSVAITYGRAIESVLGVTSEVSGYLPSKYWHSYEIEVIAP